MSDQKEKESNGAVEEIKSAQLAPSIVHSQKVRYLMAGAAVIALAIGLSTLAYMIYSADKQVTSKPVVGSAPLTALQQSDSLAQTGDYSGAQKIVAEQIAKAPNATAKTGLYLQQASIALNAKNYTDAKKYAQAAESLQPNDNTASLLGDVAALTGDKATAKQYYQTAISRLDKTANSYNTSLQDYQARLQELGQ
jgi:tetratricopeptide (TPR) repeat protein